MAEAVAAISFISAIAGLVDIGTRVVARLNDFQSKTHQVPDVLKHVKVQLPLTIDSLCRSKARAESGELGTETQNALLPTLRACTELVARLDQILIQLLPVKSDSSWEKKMKALRSLTKDTDIQNLLQELDRYIAILTLHNTSASNPTSIPPMQSRRARARTIPTNRDASFVDRPDLFRSLQIHLDKHGRAALSGIGGVGYVLFQSTRTVSQPAFSKPGEKQNADCNRTLLQTSRESCKSRSLLDLRRQRKETG